MLEGPFRGKEIGVFYPLEKIDPIINDFKPDKAVRLPERNYRPGRGGAG